VLRTNAYYSDIPLVLAAFLIWKFVKKTKVVSLSDIPLHDAISRASEKPSEGVEAEA
jgi:amino acid transporter